MQLRNLLQYRGQADQMYLKVSEYLFYDFFYCVSKKYSNVSYTENRHCKVKN